MNFVAVLCYTRKSFDQWYDDLEIKKREKRYKIKYICINSMANAVGRHYINIVRLVEWWKMENADLVEKYIDDHLIK